MNTIREIIKINEEELERGLAGTSGSWHAKYSQSAWVYVGNLDHALTEGDIICVMSQFGEIEDLHLVREEDTGKSRGFAFCKYEDARSCVLAVDNLCGIDLCGRSLRVDHVENYRLPKHLQEEEKTKEDRTLPGHAYQGQELASEYSLQRGQDLFAPLPPPPPPPAPAQQQSDKERTREDREREKKRKAKRQRKEERQRKRQEREERRRQKRARKMKEEEEEEDEERHRKKKKRKKERHHHYRDHSLSPTQRDRSESPIRDE